MSRYNTPRLITPPREEEEVYPYGRVWRSLIIVVAVVFGVTAGLYISVGFIGFNVPESLWRYVNIALALLPLAAWLLAAFWQERRVERPRRQLLQVAVIAALAANAIGIPFIDSLGVYEWLSLSDTFTRILGYGFTIGIVQEFIKYMVIRFIVWPDGFRIRSDVLAYTLAASIGYMTVEALHVAFRGTPSPDVLTLRVFSILTVHLAASIVMAYGLTQLRFSPQLYILMPLSMLAAAVVVGFATSFRSGLVNGNFVLGIGGTRPLFGLVFSLILVVGAHVGMGFLLNAAERRAREAEETDEEAP